MFDFRYHALSLVSVFLALAVGLLLGVAIGDRGLVSSAERDVRASLRQDVRSARAESQRLREDLRANQRFENAAYPLMVGGRLSVSPRIGIVALGSVPDEVVEDVRDALKDTGGRLVSVHVLRVPLDLEALGERADGTAYERLAQEPELVERFGQRVGVGFMEGGGLVRRERRPLLRSTSGRLGALDGVVVVRGPRELSGEEEEVVGDFEAGLARGLRSTDRPVVGVETTERTGDESDIPWFRERELTSVDNVDELAGRAALVFALAGADGTFGTKPTAEALLPGVAEAIGAGITARAP